jgi:hypothetical protein
MHRSTLGVADNKLGFAAIWCLEGIDAGALRMLRVGAEGGYETHH